MPPLSRVPSSSSAQRFGRPKPPNPRPPTQRTPAQSFRVATSPPLPRLVPHVVEPHTLLSVPVPAVPLSPECRPLSPSLGRPRPTFRRVSPVKSGAKSLPTSPFHAVPATRGTTSLPTSPVHAVPATRGAKSLPTSPVHGLAVASGASSLPAALRPLSEDNEAWLLQVMEEVCSLAMVVTMATTMTMAVARAMCMCPAPRGSLLLPLP